MEQEHLKMQSINIVDENIKKIAELFPNTLTEVEDEKGNLKQAIDFDVLKQELSDCIVSGREERYQFTWPEKRNSILLANSPISETLRPCVEESLGKDGTPGKFDSENLYIEGDNLDVLKLLQQTYMNKIKMIYIDPPYNTGNDFVYEDDFYENTDEYLDKSGQFDKDGNKLVQNTESNGRYHTDWLNMIYPRLKLAKNLLSKTGFIAISIGEEELYNIQKICNEVFGEQNFRNLIGIRRFDKNINLQFVDKGLKTLNVGLEYILIYSKNPDTKLKAIYKASKGDRSEKGYWKGFYNNADRPTMRYELLGVTPIDGQWKWKKEVAEQAVSNYKEYEENYSSKMSLEDYWTMTGKEKKFIRRNNNKNGKNKGIEHWVSPSDSILRNSNWSDILVSSPIGMDLKFDSPKNINVIKLLIEMFDIENNEIILDFFSGSATTAHACISLNYEDSSNRKFIMVQIPESCNEKSEAYKEGFKNICEIGKERIRRASKKIREENPLSVDNQDLGFRVLKLDSTNMKDIYYTPEEIIQGSLDGMLDNIKEDRSPEDLLFQAMLELAIPLSSTIEESTIAGKKVFNVNTEENYLLACFDSGITNEIITEIAKKKPYYFVMRDNSMANDSVATNFEQIFKTYSPETKIKVL